MHRRAICQALALSLLALPSCSRKKTAASTRIAVIPKGTTHEFWKSVHAGAVKASRELGVEIIWKGPLKEDDLKAQIDVVQSFVAQGVSGIVLAPLSDKALVGPVKAAAAAGIPVVIFDSDLAGPEHRSFVATDNRKAGRLAGDRLARSLGEKGSVVLLRYLEGSASTTNREQGFLEALREHPGVKLISDNQYGGATTESALQMSERVLAANRASDGQVAGVFCPNESTTFGMLLALRKAGLDGKVKLVGFDSSDKLVGALREGSIDGLVVQDPLGMGFTAVKTMGEILKGQAVERRIDTGARLVSRDNMDQPENRALLSPDLSPYLGR
jgi:ribose transport system substrate-binding protein